MAREDRVPPPGAQTTQLTHRVAFYETDAMGIVHHSNYIRFFEEARVQWMDEHDVPYTEWVESGLQFATTHVDVDYLRVARFDDRLVITTWAEEVRGATLHMAYRIECDGQAVATGGSEHAAVNEQGRPRRIPAERRASLRKALGQAPS
ncbi:MAG: acyl-CoA thioesterase [Proteobacteria bacterium]|nr:acyl-CoA thioesterase [Pseudomonadota bacterium]